MHYAKSDATLDGHGRRINDRLGKPKKLTQFTAIPGHRFRAVRFECGLSTEQCARVLRVTERTIRNWENGTTAVPFMAFKLMRVLCGGKHLGPEWDNWFVRHDTLHTPEGHKIKSHEMAWWSLLVRQAREFQAIMRTRRLQAANGGGEQTSPPVDAELTLEELQRQIREQVARTSGDAATAAFQAIFDKHPQLRAVYARQQASSPHGNPEPLTSQVSATRRPESTPQSTIAGAEASESATGRPGAQGITASLPVGGKGGDLAVLSLTPEPRLKNGKSASSRSLRYRRQAERS